VFADYHLSRVRCVACRVSYAWMWLGVGQDAADYFIIGESNYSQTGEPKRLHFWESRHRFQRFWPKIRHLVYWEGIAPLLAYAWMVWHVLF
jgi:hypothetical protein